MDIAVIKKIGQDYFLGLSQPVLSRCFGEISFIITTHLSGRYITFSRNMEMKVTICDSNLKILHCNARYPGSMHDSAIWNMSNMYNHMEHSYQENQHGFWLLGDSGYPLQPWLLTPIERAQEDTPEA
ncbi:protein ALP1-like [Anoplophora glabripennis]|uniref:Putative nuclease n=1 Tax=Anoplophora glabripennis TaxID=217634 RepID=V5G7U8_ANOGL|nr:protein ALP1-like [Anoplophora glabripennis]